MIGRLKGGKSQGKSSAGELGTSGFFYFLDTPVVTFSFSVLKVKFSLIVCLLQLLSLLLLLAL